MKVVMQTTMAGPKGVVQAGHVANVSPHKAKILIAGGYARAYKEPAKPLETTTAPAAENTSGPDETEKTGDTESRKDDKTDDSEDENEGGAAGGRKRGILRGLRR